MYLLKVIMTVTTYQRIESEYSLSDVLIKSNNDSTLNSLIVYFTGLYDLFVLAVVEECD